MRYVIIYSLDYLCAQVFFLFNVPIAKTDIITIIILKQAYWIVLFMDCVQRPCDDFGYVTALNKLSENY